MSRDLRTVAGFAIILAGIVLSGWAIWWFLSEGDIVRIIHDIKVGLPGWAWTALRVVLSVAAGGVIVFTLLMLAMCIFRGSDHD